MRVARIIGIAFGLLVAVWVVFKVMGWVGFVIKLALAILIVGGLSWWLGFRKNV